MFASAAALGIAFFGILTANSVCPEHALWIDAIATVTLVLTVTAVVATFKASAFAPVLTLAAACGGLSITAIDAYHEVTRNRVVAIAFAVAAVLSAFSAATTIRLRRWESSVVDDALRPLPSELSTPVDDTVDAEEVPSLSNS